MIITEKTLEIFDVLPERTDSDESAAIINKNFTTNGTNVPLP